MGIINKVAVLLQSSLGSKLDEIGRATGVIRRQRKFSGASLLKTMVLTVMKTPRPHTNDFVATAALLGVNVTAEAIEKRFSEKLVAHFARVWNTCWSPSWRRRRPAWRCWTSSPPS